MSHRKYRAPRHGSLRFCPRKRCRRHRGKVRSFPPDIQKHEPHLTAFIGYKAGMTHIMRNLKRPGSKADGKDIVEAVTIIETPPIVVVGIVGYVRTPSGLRSITTVWTSHLDDSFRRRFYKNWTRSKKKAFTKWHQLFTHIGGGEDPVEVKRRLDYIRKYADVVRVIAHSQVKKIKNLRMKKAHVMEIQINGGNVADKVDFGYKLFEKPVTVKNVFNANECIDTIAVTKGHGKKGVVSRYGVAKLPRKTHRGLRRVACIGSWHPGRVRYSVARHGQKGFHHRTEIHKKIYRIGDAIEYDADGKPTKFNASTDFDLTAKSITPMGGFVRYGVVKQDYIMIRGSCPGPKKRPITLRKPIVTPNSSIAKEDISLKFIDTSSQYGNGRFQTVEEKKEWFGPTKKDRLEESKRKAAEKKRLQKQEKSQQEQPNEQTNEQSKSNDEKQNKKSSKTDKDESGKSKKGGKKGSKKKSKGSGKKSAPKKQKSEQKAK
jgi:large subunit ribosomal protein L3e